MLGNSSGTITAIILEKNYYSYRSRGARVWGWGGRAQLWSRWLRG